ncbi:Bifunctional purine biosynthetic protein ADE5,7 [Knufia fluminis]|uniref:Phosphoribosylglycinamide formyltransferase n=1 Tax=Knufia fluminis TaxID=191047 RepID=A0AAN8I758_9EURO|nr:Bifunctional purine biosynthetic protein ADE5,7 [Knufia fluminis]
MAENLEKKEHKLMVLISGSGTNLQALIDACGTAPLENAKLTHVISNKKNAYGLTRAQNANIPTTYHNLVTHGYKKSHPDSIDKAREAYDVDLAKLITENSPKPDLVVCAGWMHILSPKFIDALTAANVPIINLHPALPGQFDGANAIGRAWEAYQRGEIAATGVMIHHVITEVDRGEPIMVEEVPCRDCETESDLEERIHKVEWRLIVQGTAKALGNV